MKKWVVSLGLLGLLAGCNGETEAEEEEETVEIEEEISETEEDESSDSDSELDEEDEVSENNSETDEEESIIGEIGEEEVENSNSMTFIPQQSDIAVGLTIENDETLSALNELILSADDSEIGIENDISIQYTGLYLYNDEIVQPVFLISNRLDQTFTNIELTISFGSNNSEMVFEEHLVFLSEEEFGTLEPNTVMPMYVETDASYLELVEQIAAQREETISIDSIQFDTVDGNSSGGRVRSQENTNPDTQNLTFVPTASQVEEGIQVDEHLVLSQIQEMIDLTPEVGIEGDVVIHWTGIYESSPTEDNGHAVFVIVNRSGTDFFNIELGIQFSDLNNNMILSGERFFLSEEEFGILEDQTIMPLYIEIPKERELYVYGVLDVSQANYEFEHFEAEEHP